MSYQVKRTATVVDVQSDAELFVGGMNDLTTPGWRKRAEYHQETDSVAGRVTVWCYERSRKLTLE